MADPEEGSAPNGDEPENTADEAQVKRKTRNAKAREALAAQAFARFLADPNGRNWMWDILERCKVFNVSFISGDPYATSFNEGQRNVGLSLFAQIPPDVFATMMKEKGNG